MKWYLQFQEFDYKRVQQHADADCLSRIHVVVNITNQYETFKL